MRLSVGYGIEVGGQAKSWKGDQDPQMYFTDYGLSVCSTDGRFVAVLLTANALVRWQEELTYYYNHILRREEAASLLPRLCGLYSLQMPAGAGLRHVAVFRAVDPGIALGDAADPSATLQYLSLRQQGPVANLPVGPDARNTALKCCEADLEYLAERGRTGYRVRVYILPEADKGGKGREAAADPPAVPGPVAAGDAEAGDGAEEQEQKEDKAAELLRAEVLERVLPPLVKTSETEARRAYISVVMCLSESPTHAEYVQQQDMKLAAILRGHFASDWQDFDPDTLKETVNKILRPQPRWGERNDAFCGSMSVDG